jgi:hypothetical protein
MPDYIQLGPRLDTLRTIDDPTAASQSKKCWQNRTRGDMTAGARSQVQRPIERRAAHLQEVGHTLQVDEAVPFGDVVDVCRAAGAKVY